MAIGLLAAGVAGFFMSGAVAQAQETALPSSYDTDGDGLIEISNLDQLNAVRWDLDGNGTPSRGYAYAVAFPVAAGGSVCPANTTCTGYELITDLDFDADGDGQITAADPYWNGRGGWDPIGTYFISNRRPDTDRPFTGVFDGNGHVIANLYINLTDDALVNTLGNRHEGVGLFGKIGGSGVVRNLGLRGVDVRGDNQSRVGGLAGINEGRISSSYAVGSVRGSDFAHIGGLVGMNYWGKISACYAAAAVVSDSAFPTGYEHTPDSVGGLVGYNLGTVASSYAAGSANGYIETYGGLVGWHRGGIIRKSYAIGSIDQTLAEYYRGGLIGRMWSGIVSASYFDTETSGQTVVAGVNHSSGITRGSRGHTTAELQSPIGYTGIYANWNLDLDGDGNSDDPWDFGSHTEYPALKADVNGDGQATWQEFGYQLRRPLVLTATASSEGKT